MPERARTTPSLNDHAVSGLEAERILEGGAELISGALRPHAELEAVLSARGWKRRFLKHPERVSALVAGDRGVREALERVHRRAAVEAWTEDVPVLRQARALSARRERLTRLARQRLDTLTVAPPDVSLEEALTRLEALLRQPVSKALKEGEVLVFEPAHGRSREPGPGMGGMNVPSLPLLMVPLGALLFILLLASGLPWARELGMAFLGLSLGGPLVWSVLRSGRVRITSERVLWTPVFGAAQAVRLDSILDDGVHLDRSQFDLVVKGDRRLCARSVRDALGLMLSLELHRQPPLLGAAARSGEQLEDVALLPAKVGDVDGVCVLRPHALAFIPDRRGPQALQAVTGKPTPLKGFEADRVLEELRWLPAAEFDACVSRVVKATGGLAWTPGDAHFVPGPPIWMAIRIKRGEQVLLARADWLYRAAAERILQGWRKRPAPPPPE
ncbi:hypothetical protein D7Y11_27990 [Corallococcus sp. AB018]|uniref:hypothetical protein n=1 Tax=Corallococcus TaxID=83461 RepID=UPI000EA0C80F|nr:MULTISPECIES: hypothetical protein [unclassified Corallococcus]RKH23029.1 hypothetical protein D7V77_25230 [Corallococcus sp. CA041A]RUO89893.1 hypothetical protein D7Y11_27990 [Corallococcus sp. AB018]